MDLSNIIQHMHDTGRSEPDHRFLFEIAASQRGYFTTAQAHEAGFGRDLLSYHTKTGRFLRVHRGLYRLRDYPSSMHEEVVAAWLAVGKDIAVVSHESALELLDLSDVIPAGVHLTVPRRKRYLARIRDAIVHTTSRPFTCRDIIVREGIRLTSPERSIVDSAQMGTGGEQIVMAVQQAIDRGITTPEWLAEAARRRSARVRELVEIGLEAAGT